MRKNKLEIDSVLFEVKNNQILNNVYLKLETGTITAVLGRNGAGKSSLFKIIMGTLKPREKSLRINEVSFFNKNPSNKDILYLSQNNFIPKKLKIKTVFNFFKLDFFDFAESFPEFKNISKNCLGTLSGGERRIIETYLILKSESKFAILDEPFSQIMPVHVQKIKNLIIQSKEKKGILISDHLYEHIKDISDEIYLVANKKVYLTKEKSDLIRLGYLRK
ncbi:ATP-binding cassette domain-containing protein [Polaribacter sp. Q13]|uniref:ATP-binding cassette domain-containing protein n=1 Tax=Polaribacter sp. Q13 TaxID=2806551 RepID=UPI00193BCAB9|nr:ATP-binding cassette domain-containing protein [Polaribacter sp. Q13]QVY66851.1 ATP-binding cassette domain-containing protein [Polaribacter sp. Q13]